ncbi:MAG: hypothetical protein RIG84_18060 [Roseovarius sp.]
MSQDGPFPPVSLARLFFKMGGWVVVIFGAVVLVITLVSQLSLMTAARFDREGVETRALVTERYRTESDSYDSDDSVSYWLTLNYVTESGEEITNTRTVGLGEYNRIAEGDEIEIRYLRSKPMRVEVTRGGFEQGAAMARWIALVVGVLWLGALWIVGRWAVEAVRARKFGEHVKAEVTEVFRTAISVNKKPRYRLKWKDYSGRTGQSLLRRKEDLDGLKAGDTIRVYKGLKRQWWAGDVGDRETP